MTREEYEQSIKENPYSEDGGFRPNKGQETEFFKWARQAREAWIASLPEAEQRKIRRADAALAKRMKS